MSVKETIDDIKQSHPSDSWATSEVFTTNDLKALVARFERYENALQHYADKNNWLRDRSETADWYDNGDHNGYDCAIDALKGE